MDPRLIAALADRYRIERELGAGGMAIVYLAQDLKHSRQVAVKVLRPEFAAALGHDRFLREITTTANLRHPNILPLFDSGEADGHVFYVMPLIEGESLRDRLTREGPLPIPDVLRISDEVADALSYAHGRGVIHRDIKPENILLESDHAIVADFGIAHAASNAGDNKLTMAGLVVGTPQYMSPEQGSGYAVDARSDLYALGCVIYEMVAGRPPFTAPTPMGVLVQHAVHPVPSIHARRPEVAAHLVAAIERALAKTPDDRHATLQEFRDAIKRADGTTAIASGAAFHKPPPTPATPLLGREETPDAAIERVDDGARVLSITGDRGTGKTSGGGYPAIPAILLGGKRRLSTILAWYAAAAIAVAIVARAAVISLGLPDWVFPGALIVMALGLPVILFTAFVYRNTHRALTEGALTPRGSPTRQSTMTMIAVKASPWVSWKRTFTGGAVALGGFSALVAAFMIMRAMGIGPVGSLLASGKLSATDQLLVTDFRGAGADSSLSAIVSEAIRTDLGQSLVVNVVPPSAVAQALVRMRRDRNTRVDLAIAREIAAREGIKAIVDGGVTPLAGGYVVTVRLVDAASGDGLASFRETIDGPGELIPTLDKLSRNLRGRIGESLKKVRANPPLERLTTASLDALRKYAEGVRAFDVEGDNLKAAGLFREAVAIDTAFGMAYRKLGVSLLNAGMSPASRDSAYEAAFRHRARMTDVERYTTEGSYYSTGKRADRRLSVQAYESLLEIDSLNPTAINNLARQYAERREYTRAESLLTRGVRTGNTRATIFKNLVVAQVSQGRFAAADSTMSMAERQFPENASVRTVRVSPLTARKQYDSVQKLVAAVRANDPDLGNRMEAIYYLSAIEYVRGRGVEGLKLSEEAHSMAESRGAVVPGITRSMDTAFVDIWFANQPAKAVARMDAAIARPGYRSMSVEERPYANVAITYAQAGRPDRARAVLAARDAESDTSLRRRNQPYHHMALGEIALAEGRPADAIREIRVGDRRPDGPRDSCLACTLEPLARAFDAAGMADSTIATLERYVGLPSPFPWPDDYALARAHHRLGELYEAKRDVKRAVQHYERFVDLWKNADPPLQPRVAAARARLAALTGSWP